MSQNSNDNPQKKSDAVKADAAQNETDESIQYGGMLKEEKWSIVVENSSNNWLTATDDLIVDSSAILIAGCGCDGCGCLK